MAACKPAAPALRLKVHSQKYLTPANTTHESLGTTANS